MLKSRLQTLIGLGLLVILAPLVLGSVHTEVVVGLLLVALATCVPTLLSPQPKGHEERRGALLSPLTIGFALAAGWSLVQLIPLPYGLFELLSPQGAKLLEGSWQAAFGHLPPSGWRPLSLDPGATADRALRWLTLAVVSLVAANQPRDRSSAGYIYGAVLVGAGAVLGVGMVQSLIDPERFLGFYQAAIGPRYTTFVSGNHAATYFGFVSLLGLYVAMRQAQRGGFRWAIVAGVTCLGTTIVLVDHDSSGANAAYALAMAYIFVALVLTTSDFRPLLQSITVDRRRLLGALSGLVTLGLLVAWVAGDAIGAALRRSSLWTWFFQSGETRWDMAGAALRASADYPILGAGAGATERVIYPYLPWGDLQARIPTLENEPLEWIFTFGWPVAVALIVILLLPLLRYASPIDGDRSYTRFRRAFLGGFTVYGAIVSLLHFPFFTLGIAVPFTVIMESLMRRLHRTERVTEGRRMLRLDLSRRATRVVLWLSLFAGVTAVTLAFGPYATPEEPTRADVGEQAEVERLVWLAPGEGRTFLELASRARLEGDAKRAVTLARRAVELEPTVNARIYLAYLLALSGEQEEAAQLYAELLPLAGRAVQDAARYIRRPETLARIAGASSAPELWIRLFRAMQKVRHVSVVSDFALAMADAHPDALEVHRMVVESYWRAKAFDVAILWSEMLALEGITDAEGRPFGYSLWVESLRRSGDDAEAWRVARRAIEQVPGDPMLQRQILELRPRTPAQAQDGDVDAVARAAELFCHTATGGHEVHLCLLSQSFLAEAGDDLDEAEELLERYAFRFDRPQPLGQLFLRQHNCVKLRAWVRRWESRVDEPNAALERMYDQCVAR